MCKFKVCTLKFTYLHLHRIYSSMHVTYLARKVSHKCDDHCDFFSVYGWFETEFTATENEESYLLNIGVIKGSPTFGDLVYLIELTEGTASKS